jgi:hypothetical protein
LAKASGQHDVYGSIDADPDDDEGGDWNFGDDTLGGRARGSVFFGLLQVQCRMDGYAAIELIRQAFPAVALPVEF